MEHYSDIFFTVFQNRYENLGGLEYESRGSTWRDSKCPEALPSCQSILDAHRHTHGPPHGTPPTTHIHNQTQTHHTFTHSKHRQEHLPLPPVRGWGIVDLGEWGCNLLKTEILCRDFSADWVFLILTHLDSEWLEIPHIQNCYLSNILPYECASDHFWRAGFDGQTACAEDLGLTGK